MRIRAAAALAAVARRGSARRRRGRRRPAGAATGTLIISKRIIGYSVQHRPIVAYHLGNPDSRTQVVLVLGEMHGDEHAGVTVVNVAASTASGASWASTCGSSRR